MVKMNPRNQRFPNLKNLMSGALHRWQKASQARSKNKENITRNQGSGQLPCDQDPDSDSDSESGWPCSKEIKGVYVVDEHAFQCHSAWNLFIYFSENKKKSYIKSKQRTAEPTPTPSLTFDTGLGTEDVCLRFFLKQRDTKNVGAG